MESKEIKLPANDAVQNWFEENIDKDCSASSAVYKFRQWLESQGNPTTGPGWVKASEFKYEMSVTYHAYIGVTKGAGWFDTVEGDDIFNWSDGGDTLQCQFKDLYILDESAGESDAVDDWIDVNERLPYKDGDSSVYCLVNDTYDGIVVRPFNEAHQCWDGEDGDDYYTDAKGGKITHWKPLPEPPKRKQQKEK